MHHRFIFLFYFSTFKSEVNNPATTEYTTYEQLQTTSIQNCKYDKCQI